MTKMEWLKENIVGIVALLVAWTSSVIVAYNAIEGRVIVLEQRAIARDKELEFISQDIAEIKTNVKDIDLKTDELVKYLIPLR